MNDLLKSKGIEDLPLEKDPLDIVLRRRFRAQRYKILRPFYASL